MEAGEKSIKQHLHGDKFIFCKFHIDINIFIINKTSPGGHYISCIRNDLFLFIGSIMPATQDPQIYYESVSNGYLLYQTNIIGWLTTCGSKANY